MFISEQEAIKRKHHNDNIADVPEVIANGTIFGDWVIVKLLYYTDHTITEGGLIEPSFKIGETADGRPKPTFNDKAFAPVGYISKVGDGEIASKYKVGSKIWLDYRNLNTGTYDFLLDMENPVSKPQGFVRVPAQLITFIEHEPS